jgi:hypothetical protein
MKKILTIAVIVLAASSLALNQTESKSSRSQNRADEQAIAQLERELANAYIRADAKTLDRILADELTDTSDDGLVFNKEYHLKYLTPRPGLTVDLPRMNIRVYGQAAVVTGIAVFKFNNADPNEAVYYRFTDTFVKRQRGWQLIATQRQRIPVWNARLMDDRELKVLTIQDCSQEPSLRSLNSQTPTFVRFTNATTQTVIVYWLNYEGSRDSSEDQKVTLQSGQSGVRSTYLTHPFLVTDVTGKCLGIYQPAREPSLAVIK